MGYNKGMLVGSALGALLGSLAKSNYPQEFLKTLQNGTDKAHEALSQMHLFHKDEPKKNNLFWVGSLLGTLTGLGALVLVNPKTNKAFKKQFISQYNDIKERAQSLLKLVNEHKKHLIKDSKKGIKKTAKKAQRKVVAKAKAGQKKVAVVKRKAVSKVRKVAN